MVLKPESRTGPERNVFLAHIAGLVGLVIGMVGFAVVAFTQEKLWMEADLRLAVPFLLATIAAGAVSFARREGAIWLPLLGVGLAACAMVLGYVVIFGAVVLATVVIIVILHEVL